MADEQQAVLDIIIDGDQPPPQPAQKKQEKPKEAKKDDESHPLVIELRKQLADAQAASARERADIERRAAGEIEKARVEAGESRIVAVTNAITTAKAGIAEAKRRLSAAYESGEFEKAADISAEIAAFAADLKSYERDKATAELQAKEPQQKTIQQDNNKTGIEKEIAGYTPRSQEWFRAHPECVTDKRLRSKVTAAHYEAESEGYVPDTDAYFSFINERMGFTKKQHPDRSNQDDDGDEDDVDVKSVPPAPPARAPGAATERRRETYRMTREERDAAEAMGMTPEAYAAARLKINELRGKS